MTAAPRRRADPLAALHARQLLDVGDARVNCLLRDAGLLYRQLHQASAYPGPAGADLTRVVVDGGRGGPGADRSAIARDKLRAADAIVGRRCLPVLVGVVVEERPIGELRELIVETKDRASTDAVVLDRLRESLHRLADLWGMTQTNTYAPMRASRSA